MSAIKWRDQLSVGVPEIDKDHKGLINCINRLEVVITAPQFQKIPVLRVIHDLLEYTHAHFSREEELMLRIHYPDYEAHFHEHLVCVQRMRVLSLAFLQEMDRPNAEALYQYAVTWLIEHIIHSDRKIAPYSRGVWL